MSDPTPHRELGYYWVRLGDNPPEVAFWDGSSWLLCGNTKLWHPSSVEVLSERLILRPRLTVVQR
ncbi:MAG: hypothetical protein INR62_07285 [Rhodospirillales bacterium]|nr:hypothetical protein [Acetobacter sp.]